MYLIELPDFKKYFGCTKNYKHRVVTHKYRFDNKKSVNKDLYDSMRMFQWHEININSVGEVPNEQADQFEKDLIKFFDTMNPENGFNKTSGGKKGYNYSKDTKESISKNNFGLCKKSKPFYAYMGGLNIGLFKRISDAGKQLKLDNSHICKVLKKKLNQTGGYTFIYQEKMNQKTP